MLVKVEREVNCTAVVLSENVHTYYLLRTLLALGSYRAVSVSSNPAHGQDVPVLYRRLPAAILV